jgi:hypothetical protein
MVKQLCLPSDDFTVFAFGGVVVGYQVAEPHALTGNIDQLTSLTSMSALRTAEKQLEPKMKELVSRLYPGRTDVEFGLKLFSTVVC